MYLIFLCQKRNIQGCSVLTKLQTSSLKYRREEGLIHCSNLHTEGVLPPNSPTTVSTVRKPALLPADHVEPVGEVSVLAGDLTGSVRVRSGGAQLHSNPREFADLEVVTSL